MMNLDEVKEMIKRTDLKLEEVKEMMRLSDMKEIIVRKLNIDVSSQTIFDQLKKEHDELQSLLAKTLEAPAHEREALLQKICTLLIPHARGEEKTLYALMHQKALAGPPEALTLVNDGYEEHHVADELVAELKGMDHNNERWPALFKVLKENLEHHIKAEENDIWEQGKKMFTKDELRTMLGVYSIVKAKYAQTLPDQSAIREREPAPEAVAAF